MQLQHGVTLVPTVLPIYKAVSLALRADVILIIFVSQTGTMENAQYPINTAYFCVKSSTSIVSGYEQKFSSLTKSLAMSAKVYRGEPNSLLCQRDSDVGSPLQLKVNKVGVWQVTVAYMRSEDPGRI